MCTNTYRLSSRSKTTARATRVTRDSLVWAFEGTFLPVPVSRGLSTSCRIEVRMFRRIQGSRAPAGHCSIEVSPLHLVACARECFQSHCAVIAVM
jgi:hypothetical protein